MDTPMGRFKIEDEYIISINGAKAEIISLPSMNVIHTVTVKGAKAVLDLESRCRKWIYFLRDGHCCYSTKTVRQ
jgi:hypothetical protein